MALKFGWIFSVGLFSSSVFLKLSCFAAESSSETSSTGETLPKIAIIGGGLGGTSCAYFIRKLFGPSAHVTLYEPHELGGRIATVDIAGRTYEAGGSIIHPKNRYMVQFVKKFGLSKRKSADTTMGAYDGEEFVFESSSWGMLTALKMIWRYGWNVFRLQSEISAMMTKFENIYSLQEAGTAFNTVPEMIDAMGGESMTSTLTTPLDELLKKAKFTQRFLDEIVPLATRVNYGQETSMEGFAGFISLAGAQSGLWAVEGGNKLVAQKLAEKANLTELRQEAVTKVIQEKGQYQVQTAEDTSNFDIVVIATPLERNMSHIQFDTNPPLPEIQGEYRSTYATFIDADAIDPEAFGRQAGQYIPDQVISTKNIPLQIRSAAKNFPVDFKSGDEQNYVYKIFSTNHITEKQMRTIFKNVRDKQEFPWLAYPYYRDVKLENIPPFVLREGLYYANAVEWAASAMEMAVIGGRNVAILAHQYWNNQSERTPGSHSQGEEGFYARKQEL